MAEAAPAAVTITALVIRRFNVKANGVASVEQVVKQVELPALPCRDVVLDFADGTGEALVSTVRMRASGAQPPALAPPRVEIKTRTEDGAGLVLALKAGWAALPADDALLGSRGFDRPPVRA